MNTKIKRFATALSVTALTLVSSACTSDTLKENEQRVTVFECTSTDYSITLSHFENQLEATVTDTVGTKQQMGTLNNEFSFETYIRPQVTMHTLDFSVGDKQVSLYDRTDPDIGPEKVVGFTIEQEGLETDYACEGASFSKLYLLDNP
jgi:hypothetical protein